MISSPMIVCLITHFLRSPSLKRNNVDIRSLVKTRLRINPGHHLTNAEIKLLHETRDAARRKLEEIEKFILEDPEKGEAKPAEKDKDKGKSKEHLASDAEDIPHVSVEPHQPAVSSKPHKSEGGVKGVLAAARGEEFVTREAPSKALKDGKQSSRLHGRPDGDNPDDYDDELAANAFNHPSTYQNQPWIWIPQWEAHPEISAQLVEDIKAGGVEASDIGAIIDDHSTVWVKRNPPDEDWDG